MKLVALILFLLTLSYGVEKISKNEPKFTNLKEVIEQNENDQKRCDGGDLNQCFWLGKWYLENPQIPNEESKYEKAYKLFQIACDNNAEFCPKVANIYYRFNDDPKKYQRMEEFYIKSCNENYAGACRALGDFYAKGDELKQDYPKAREFYSKTCKVDSKSLFCISEENIHEFRLNDNQSLKKFCDAGDMKSCFELGDNVLQREYKIKDDFLKAQELFQKSCNGGEKRGCWALGLMYVSDFWSDQSISKYIPTDYQKGFKLLDKSCKEGLLNACYYLAWMYADNLGVKNSFFLPKSELYFDKACDNGLKDACKDIYGRHKFIKIFKPLDSSKTFTKETKILR